MLFVEIKPVETSKGYTFNRIVLINSKTNKEVFDLSKILNSKQRALIKYLSNQVKSE